ncbi:DUF4282 domain-containing protein [Corynebacterium breve]|uniref:DUF4282 domain-containing protein n=1 Tax=Corynebacterium breve TaxID=3049799 RepID=A0ABY8VJ11_9CORY|nr:DUF4282 domain-containing protein [Corynebacterium breve]WIM68223.1 DUF4282 domain-containing protein [Corynebacterium breve]
MSSPFDPNNQNNEQPQSGYAGYSGYGQQQNYSGYQDPNQGFQQPFPAAPEANKAEANTANGFMSALFDFSFTQFVTIKFAKIIYIILMVIFALTWLAWILSSFAAFSESAGLGIGMLLLTIIGGGIFFIVSLVYSRVMLEFVISMIRTAQNTGELVEESRKA